MCGMYKYRMICARTHPMLRICMHIYMHYIYDTNVRCAVDIIYMIRMYIYALYI